VAVFGIGPMSFTLSSRGIGPGYAIPVQTLAFAGGTAQTNLPARQAAYYAVTIPPNTTSWKVRLATNSGDSCLVVLKDALPNITATDVSSATNLLSAGRRMKKIGDEQFLLLPSPGQSYLPSGTYYLAAISEGANASAVDEVGADPSQFTLTSLGEAVVENLGEVGEIGIADIVVSGSLAGGEVKLHRFTVPPGTLNVEARVEASNGFPVIALNGGMWAPDPSASLAGYTSETPAGYGTDGGVNPGTYVTASLMNVANPTNVFTLAIKARGVGASFSNASYTLRLNSSKAQIISFNGGSSAVTNQSANTWRYFRVVVPTNVLGWDLRLVNVSTGLPRMVVCREALPSSLGTTIFTPGSAVAWPTNAQ
jgi:hypothetical protein